MLCIFVGLRIGMLAAHVLSCKAILQIAGMCMFAHSFLHTACCTFLWTCVVCCCFWLLTAEPQHPAFVHQPNWAADQAVHQPHVQLCPSRCGPCLQGHRGQWPRTHGQAPGSHWFVFQAWVVLASQGGTRWHPGPSRQPRLHHVKPIWCPQKRPSDAPSGHQPTPPPWPKHGIYNFQRPRHQGEAIPEKPPAGPRQPQKDTSVLPAATLWHGAGLSRPAAKPLMEKSCPWMPYLLASHQMIHSGSFAKKVGNGPYLIPP